MSSLPKPEMLLALPEGFEIWRIAPALLREQDKNARVLSSPMFKSLVRNVQARGALESLPLVHREHTTFSIISGHHRVRAAIQAELPTIIVLADPMARTRSEIVAKQVAHNAIQGSDDTEVLLQLIDQIIDVDARIEAAITRQEVEDAARRAVAVQDIKVSMDWKIVTFSFLPTQVRDLEQLSALIPESSFLGALPIDQYDDFRRTMQALSKAEEIRSVSALIYRMIELTKAHLEGLPPAPPAEEPAKKKRAKR
jgi:hypothetical protein